VSGAAALVAETGSVLLAADRTPVRSATVLARRHVVVAREADLVPDLAAALERHPPVAGASWSGFVTGPSRTADIEKRLVLGVHGPLALDVLLLAR
jgi:L-lactate dehydrogenase complex protein LldG